MAQERFQLQCSVVEEGDPYIVAVSGEVVFENVEELRAFLLKIGESKTGTVVLDLAGLEFIDTSGLGVLVGMRSQFKRYGKELRLANPREKVLKILRLTRLSTVFGLEA